MPAYTNPTALPRQEDLALCIVQGRGANRLNIWRNLGPMVPVDHRQGRMAKMDIANAGRLRIMNKVVAPGADIERWTATIGTQAFSILIRKEEIKLPDEEQMDWGEYFDLEAALVQNEVDTGERTIEYLAAGVLLNTANFGSAVNTSYAYTAANLANINFAMDIIAAVRRGRNMGEVYNTIIIPGIIWDRIALTPLLLQYVLGQLGAGSGVDADSLVKAFARHGITKVLIADSIYNNAPEAQESLSYIWTQFIWVGETSDSFTMSGGGSAGGFMEVEGAIAFLYWDNYVAGKQGTAGDDLTTDLEGSDSNGYLVETYRHEPQESNIVRLKTSTTPYCVDPRRGTLINPQYA